MVTQNLSYNYDTRHDVLYVSIGFPRPSYGDEIYPGIVLKHDIDTDELTGVTILDCKARYLENDPVLTELPSELAGIDFEVGLLIT